MSPRDTSTKRESILDAALRAFESEGYDNASMDRVADLAGASKRTVYNHFPSKEALFKAVVDRFMTEVAELKRIPYDPDRSLEDQLGQFAAAKLSVLDNPAWMGLMRVGLGVMVRDPELAHASLAQAQTGESHLVRWLQDATADGRLNVPDPELASEVFWAMVSGVYMWPHLLEQAKNRTHLEALRREIVEMFLARYRQVPETA
jgi:TetR/AcrR family transcriptional regulator of autoinduction and epiphytic fitness